MLIDLSIEEIRCIAYRHMYLIDTKKSNIKMVKALELKLRASINEYECSMPHTTYESWSPQE